MQSNVLLVTPPFTQLNTPYPATAYLKGFLDSVAVQSNQVDLSIELFCKIFSKDGLKLIFEDAEELEEMAYPEIYKERKKYIDNITVLISFLQSSTSKLQNFEDAFQNIPRFHRFKQNEKVEFDEPVDRAKFQATLCIEELGDFIQANIDPDFGFSKYAESIARAASSFQPLQERLEEYPSIVEQMLMDLMKEKIDQYDPTLVCITIPFPGNLMGALRCGQFIKAYDPEIMVAFGGGYCNTELRKLSDPMLFEYTDFVLLDDGEAPLEGLIEFLKKGNEKDLKNTFLLKDEKVVFENNSKRHYSHSKLPKPTYNGLDLEKYISFLEINNPMHRLWSDGHWNKLTVSHGCYWAKCSFCDISLDYIGRYENDSVEFFVNKMEDFINETGYNTFHFVDEAAPPKMLKAISQEIIKRGLDVRWWTNIRFEKTFDQEICALMSKAGCIAVTGGLEVASDRLLKLMDKGVTVEQVAKVTKAFSDNNILVHAYLMYGFPTQTEQETIDALEVVRKLFKDNCIQSGFWHRFAATAHSPVGQNPEAFHVKITGPEFQGFAENDLFHEDPTGANHYKFTKGLNKALFNYMNGIGLDWPVEEWFDFEVPKTL